MKRDEYIAQLKKYLKRLPKKEYDSAIEYFTEYFDEAGPEREQEIIQELGQPKEAAKEMLLQLLNEGQTEEKQHSFLKTLGIIVLVLCASPIALPSLLTLIVGLFCVVLFVGCIFLALFCVVVAGILSGGYVFIQSLTLIGHSLAGFIVLFGMSLLCIGLGILVGLFSVWLAKWIGIGLVKLTSRIARKESK